MLLIFKFLYGDVPLCNKQGVGFKVSREFNYFNPKRIKRIIEEVGS